MRPLPTVTFARLSLKDSCLELSDFVLWYSASGRLLKSDEGDLSLDLEDLSYEVIFVRAGDLKTTVSQDMTGPFREYFDFRLEIEILSEAAKRESRGQLDWETEEDFCE